MTLDEVRCGQEVKIVSVAEGFVRVQAIRLGISAGETVRCIEKIWQGPIIIDRAGQQIAVGRSLARRIRVYPVW